LFYMSSRDVRIVCPRLKIYMSSRDVRIVSPACFIWAHVTWG